MSRRQHHHGHHGGRPDGQNNGRDFYSMWMPGPQGGYQGGEDYRGGGGPDRLRYGRNTNWGPYREGQYQGGYYRERQMYERGGPGK